MALTKHSTGVTDPTNTVDPNTLNCLTSGCHVSGTSPFVAAGNVHDPDDCANCHNSAGTLISATNGDASGTTGQCSQCHTAFDQHNAHTSATHAVTTGSDTDGTYSCDTCHGVGGTSKCYQVYTIDTWGAADGIYDLHFNVCTTCHDSARNDADGNVAAVIQAGAATCLDCHATKRFQSCPSFR